MKHQQQEKGLAHLGIIIVILLVIAAVAFGGWYVWQKKEGDSGRSDGANQVNSQETSNGTGTEPDKKSFNCKDIFTVAYPDSMQATVTDAQQCLISNVSTSEMPPSGPLPPEQLGLFFSSQVTKLSTSKEYLDDYIERSQEDFPLELKSQQEIELDNGKDAILAVLYGGHPIKHDFYFFIYIKDTVAITTSYPTNSDYKEATLEILKSIR